jgi:hypothetical protein
MVERLRTHLILAWLITAIVCFVGVGVVRVTNARGAGDELGPVTKALASAVSPTLLALVSSYFVVKPQQLRVTRGQRMTALIISYTYLFAVFALSVGPFIFGLPHEQCGNENLALLAPWQGIIAAPVAYLFGQSARD